MKEPPSDLYAKEGTEIFDSEGRLFATLTRDVFRQDIVGSDMFCMADGTVLKPGDPMPEPIRSFCRI